MTAQQRYDDARLGDAPRQVLKRGDLVYRVADSEEFGPKNQAYQSWKVVTRTVKVVSDKVIFIDAFFPGMVKKNFEVRALGTVFFATEQEAVQAFARQAQAGLESAKRAIELAERQKNWVARWTSDTHQNLGSKQCPTTEQDTKQRSLKFSPPSKRSAQGSVS